MKLKSFRIWHYKSIIDSGECRLSDNDNILILAGQNESGKSAILQALDDYERGELRENCERKLAGDVYPKIKCTYTIEKDDNIVANISTEEKPLPSVMQSILGKLKEISIVRTFTTPEESTLSFDSELLKEITEAIEKDKKTGSGVEEEQQEGAPPETVQPVEDVSVEDLAENIFGLTPVMIFFDDFCDLLPNKILVSDLKNKNKDAKGYNAVRNVEKILEVDFAELDELSDAVRKSREDAHNNRLTADFNERWKQKIYDDNKVEICVEYNQGGAEGQSYFNFYVLTKDKEYLIPQQRSKGLLWFLSFYLQLTAESKSTQDLIILFDEPGLYLHSKAQNDIKGLFKELAEKDQIIYSTHSPYMIDSDKLHRLRLVINSKEVGTTVEKITTRKIKNQKDALKPIIDAMGLEVAHDFSCIDKKNVIVEGISDYYYFTAMKKLSDIQDDFAFLPSMGATNIHLLMELCMGWGLNWLIIFDDGRQSRTEFNKIKKAFFDNKEDKACDVIFTIPGKDAIEEVFALSDLKLVQPDVTNDDNKPHSQLVKDHGGKELFARMFLEKVNNGEITQDKISINAKDVFNSVFDFINKGFESGASDVGLGNGKTKMPKHNILEYKPDENQTSKFETVTKNQD